MYATYSINNVSRCMQLLHNFTVPKKGFIMDTKQLEDLPSKDGEIIKGEAHIVVELIEYEHDKILRKTIMKKATGSINALSFEAGQGLNESISAFDTYVQVIDGSASIFIGSKPYTLEKGAGIMIPAHQKSHIQPNGRFKLIITVIKSGYE
jgi:quercetin dioxygenase-like cupin family protein